MNAVTVRELSSILKKQKYQLVGRHSATKKCRWLHNSLTENRSCYKQKFYGIESHRCIQMTPSLNCNMRCKFCWRIQPDDLTIPWNSMHPTKWDDPLDIVKDTIKAQSKILSGYKSGVNQGIVDKEKYSEALNPKHIAISLDGEPTLYPHLDALINEFRKRDMTVILVTNGSNPEVLESLSEEPNQLYISLSAPDPKTFIKTCRPLNRNIWSNIMRSLSILSSFKCPTSVRITLVKDLNLKNPDGYARILKSSQPTYVEAKSYIYVGYSRKRLNFESMPMHRDIVDFSKQLAHHMSYNILDEVQESRVVLLSKLENSIHVC